ncbi:MAG: class F sortase [Candidatus Pacebacteria bacterium]|jgi:sortase (surface protein transpeptidase)|nr:class F sortase [Candidatus Paceibacterota bacterium]
MARRTKKIEVVEVKPVEVKPLPQEERSQSRFNLDRGWIQRHYRTVVAFVVGVVVVFALTSFPQDIVVVQEPADATIATTTEKDKQGLERSSPKLLRIPSVGIETEFEGPLGLKTDGTVEVPDSYEEVGWYEYGPTPGELGPAVVLGHVDSYQGPAVFYSIGQLEPGDEIFIDRADGKTVTFVVERFERHDQDDFPTVAVYGDIDHAGLRLITCTGIYDRVAQSYSHNLIVFASIKEE